MYPGISHFPNIEPSFISDTDEEMYSEVAPLKEKYKATTFPYNLTLFCSRSGIPNIMDGGGGGEESPQFNSAICGLTTMELGRNRVLGNNFSKQQ